jgi:hypothetical protein
MMVLLHSHVRDDVVWRGEPVTLRAGLGPLLREVVGFSHVGWYDVASGLGFGGAQGDERAGALLRQCEPTQPSAVGADSTEREDRARTALDGLRSTMGSPGPLNQMPPLPAVTAIADLLRQDREPIAIMVDGVDALLDPATFPDGPLMTAQLLRAVEEPGTAGEGPSNLLLLIADELHRVPASLRAHARVATVSAALPDNYERVAALTARVHSFAGAAGLDEAARSAAVSEIALLMDGEPLWALRALERTSIVAGIGLDQGARLVRRSRRGVERDPWQSLSPDKVVRMRELLGAHVAGQDAVLAEVGARFVAAWVGINATPSGPVATRPPRLVLLLVGATGVGKTELAKAIAREVFGDEGAIIRQDMSEFQQPHDAQRLGGAPPGYVGHDAGGELTERVRQRPFSVVLLDEIEKADASMWDRLLQVVDEGRLTDGHGRTVDFGDSILLLTSNLGSAGIAGLPREESGAPAYAAIRDHCLEAVRAHMSDPRPEGLGRPELHGRLEDDVLVFDVLREPTIHAIVEKLVGWWVANAASERGLTLHVDPEELTALVIGDLGPAGSWHGRTIRNSVRRRLERPVAAQIAGGAMASGTSGRVSFGGDGHARLVLNGD